MCSYFIKIKNWQTIKSVGCRVEVCTWVQYLYWRTTTTTENTKAKNEMILRSRRRRRREATTQREEKNYMYIYPKYIYAIMTIVTLNHARTVWGPNKEKERRRKGESRSQWKEQIIGMTISPTKSIVYLSINIFWKIDVFSSFIDNFHN